MGRDSLTGERRHKAAKEGDMGAKWEKRFRRQKHEVNNNAADARVPTIKQLKVTFCDEVLKSDEVIERKIKEEEIDILYCTDSNPEENPFRDGGSISLEADIMLKMWKENKLGELYRNIENHDKNNIEEVNEKENSNEVNCMEDVVSTSKTEGHVSKCCAVM